MEPAADRSQNQITETSEEHKELFNSRNQYGDDYRNYRSSSLQIRVEENYRKQHTQMTVQKARELATKWLRFDHGEFTVMEVIDLLDSLVDESDPDLDVPNSLHAFMVAESMRKAYPAEDMDWFWVCGLIHDLGKVMSVWGEQQWCVVGDTYPLGCRPSDKVVFNHQFQDCADQQPDSPYGSEYGMYEPQVGLDGLLMAWGHDEFMYQVLQATGTCTLPAVGLKCIRFHSFYPWHNQGAYTHLTTEADETEVKPWVQRFQKFDLYSKGDDFPPIETLKPFYQSLLEKYGIGGKLKF